MYCDNFFLITLIFRLYIQFSSIIKRIELFPKQALHTKIIIYSLFDVINTSGYCCIYTFNETVCCFIK